MLGEMRQHLIGADEQVLGRTEQHHLLGRVAAAGEDLECAAADLQQFAGDEPASMPAGRKIMRR